MEYRSEEKILKNLNGREILKSSTSLLIREVQIKTTFRFHLTPIRMAKINKTVTACSGENVE